MELYCAQRAPSHLLPAPFSPRPRICSSLSPRPPPFLFRSKSLASLPTSELRCPGASESEETFTFVSEKFEEPPVSTVEKSSYADIPANEDENVIGQSELIPAYEEKFEIGDFLSKYNLKLDSTDSYRILLYGAGALLVLSITSAIVGAVDSIPLFPKLLELVGIGYTIWFSYQYLLFKESREDLFTKIADLKEQIIGRPDGD